MKKQLPDPFWIFKWVMEADSKNLPDSVVFARAILATVALIGLVAILTLLSIFVSWGWIVWPIFGIYFLSSLIRYATATERS